MACTDSGDANEAIVIHDCIKKFESEQKENDEV